MNTPERIRLPGFTADAAIVIGSLRYARTFPTLGAETGVVAAGSEICNCNCAGGQPSSGTSTTSTSGTSGSPGVCSCSSFLGFGCSTSSNSCNPGYVPVCNCGVIGNSCQCVPGGT